MNYFFNYFFNYFLLFYIQYSENEFNIAIKNEFNIVIKKYNYLKKNSFKKTSNKLKNSE